MNEVEPSRGPYDLVVIGGGPAGVIGAVTAARLGKKVALVDREHGLGGAGVNTGTVPSKTLRETALAISGVRARKLVGVDLSLRREATVGDFLHHEQEVKSAANSALLEMLESEKIDVFDGVASFVDPHTIRVERTSDAPREVSIRGDRILLATGSTPTRPPLFRFEDAGIYDSDTILQLERLPKTLAVIGAGVVGSEYACTFAALGPKVHVVDGRDVLLPSLDPELSRAVTDAMEASGVVFHWNERAERCERQKDGFVLTLRSGATLRVDAVLVAAGRRSNTDRLGLAAAGVAVGEHGVPGVDEHFQTNLSHVHAVGDVIGAPALASTGMQQARHAVRHAFGSDNNASGALFPTGIYTIPEIGTIGALESSLVRDGVDYVVGRARYERNARGRIIGELGGLLKILVRREDLKLLGVHVVGDQATEIVHLGMLAMLGGLTATALEDACFNVPTLGELFSVAAREALEQLQLTASRPPAPCRA